MTIILPRDYHQREALEKHGVECIETTRALKEDIRPLRVGILNIMPKVQTYEFSLLHPLGRSILQIIPVWIRLKTHEYRSSDADHIRKTYVTFEEAVASAPLDGLLLTGAPVEEIPFEEVHYWEEIKAILSYARRMIPSTLGICWGGLALARMIGIEKKRYSRKLFGVFETRNLNQEHPITGNLDDIFWCPQSRHSGINDDVMTEAEKMGIVNLLAYSKSSGYVIFESSDRRFLMHLGHPEYHASRLVEEFRRDLAAGRADVAPPENLDTENPLNRWKGQSTEFFSQWIKYIHKAVSFNDAPEYSI
jgi:homoserine O-succinyltransferase